MKRIVLSVMVGTALVVLSATNAAAQLYGPGMTITVDPPVIEPGGLLTVSGSGCGPEGTPVSIAVNGTPATTTAASSTNTFSATLVAPSVPGTYTLTATCSDLTASVSFEVSTGGGTSVRTNGALPVTGSDNRTLSYAGLTLVVAGGVILFVTQQRRRSSR